MCVRCGTGRIAMCTDPFRHETVKDEIKATSGGKAVRYLVMNQDGTVLEIDEASFDVIFPAGAATEYHQYSHIPDTTFVKLRDANPEHPGPWLKVKGIMTTVTPVIREHRLPAWMAEAVARVARNL